MPIIEPVIRPPSEAGSFLLQVTTGCSGNNCSFCGAYMDKPFNIKDYGEIAADIEAGAGLYPDAGRVFLMDGDALVMKNAKLLPVLKKLNKEFTGLARVSSYANGYNITKRSAVELKELCDQKLKIIYIGLESGSQRLLDMCGKLSSAEEMTEAVLKAAGAGIKSSVIVLLGLGGKKYSKMHAAETAKVLNRMQPRYLSFLSLMLIPGTRKYEEYKKGEFEELDPLELLKEARDMIEGLELKKTVFRSDHASNYLPLEGRLPHDKEKLLAMLDAALSGKKSLRPEFLRGL